MVRHRTLQCILVFVGLAFVACLYPLSGALTHLSSTDISRGDQMILGIYVPIGFFLLMAARKPAAHRALIACIGFSNLAHVLVMVIQDVHDGSLRDDAVAFAVMAILSAAMILLLPATREREQASAVGAL